MKLLVLVNSTIWGGAEIFLWRLLRELTTQGHPVVVVYPPRGGDFDRFRELPQVAWQNEALGLPVGRLRGMGSLAMMLAPRRGRMASLLERMKREHHCDTVLSQDPREQILTAMAGPELGYRVVWIIHQRLYYPLHRTLIDPKLRRAMQQTDLAFVISEATRRALILKGFPENKMRPLRVGIEQPGIEPARPVTQSTSRPRSIGVLTRLTYDKGVQDILEAMPSVLLEFPEAKLWIAGDGPCRRKLEALTRKLGITPSVNFLGWVSSSWEFLSRISVLVHATFNPGESMPTCLLEASAAGTPVVATRWNGIPEIVLDRETGLLVAPHDVSAIADAIKSLLRDPAWGASLGKNGQEFVIERFTMKAVARTFLEGAAGGGACR